jgi:hypothetical protein
MRQSVPSVFARLEDRELVLDLRTLMDTDIDEVIGVVRGATT